MGKNINIEVFDKYAIFHLSGQYTGDAETDVLIEEFEKILNVNNPGLIVDFEHTTYLSSIVIGLLVKMYAKFAEADGRLIICALNDTLKSVLRMTKVDTVLYITETLEEAKSKFE